MRDSYFLTKSYGSTFAFKSYGCCESLSSNMSGTIYELIVYKEIENETLRRPEIIERYLSLISDFLQISIKRVEIPLDKIPGVSSYTNKIKSEEDYIVFELGKHLSNKHLVATHNLIRYLWYTEHNDIANAVLSLDRLNTNLGIEDIFAIAHSFSINDGRALTGRPMASTPGLIYFPKPEKYLKGLKANNNFNNVFDSNGIIVIPSFKIKGTFFDNSEFNVNSKMSLTALTSFDKDENSTNLQALSAFTDMYIKCKPIYEKATDYLINGGNRRVFRKFDIECNNVEDVTKIDVSLGTPTSASVTNLSFKTVEELNEKLFV